MRSHDICTGSARDFLIGEWEVLQGEPDVGQTGSRHHFEAVDPAPSCHDGVQRPTICGSFYDPGFRGRVTASETWKMI